MPHQDPSARLDRRDLLWIVALLAFLGLLVLRTFDFASPPYEDPAILLRYSQHLAQGLGIVWNPGEKPVDGATDFLFMVLVAAVSKLGLSVERAAQAIGLASHFLTCVVLYAGVRKLHAAPRWMALLSAGYLAVGPGLRYIEAGYAPPTYALFACTSWFFAYRIRREGVTSRNAVAFALNVLILGLVRPEGVFFGLLMLLSVVLSLGWSACRRLLWIFALVFGVPGAIYFFWRWSYFGYPLPNPYYIKGRGTIYPRRAVNGALQLVRLMGPFVPLFLYSIFAAVMKVVGGHERRTEGRRLGELSFVLVPVGGFLVIGMLHEGLMDYLMRFQYGSVPLLLLSWPALLLCAASDWGWLAPRNLAQRRFAAAGIVALFLVALGYELQAYGFRNPHRWGTLDVARILANYPHEYTIAVTNAGHLPLFSGWRAIDVWGLNDQEIAHEGISEEFLDRYRPEVIQFDAGFTPLDPEAPEIPLPWHRAVATARAYAESRDYVLAAAFAKSFGAAHYYYVRRDFPESAEIVRRIRELDYRFLDGGSLDLGPFDPRSGRTWQQPP